MKSFAIKGWVKALMLSSTALTLPTHVFAAAGIPMPAEAQSVDGNGVDVLNAISRPSMGQISIGSGDAGLSRQFQFNYDDSRDNFSGRFNYSTFSYGEKSVDFSYPADVPFECNVVSTGYTLTYGGKGINNGYCNHRDLKLEYFNSASTSADLNTQITSQIYTLVDRDGTRVKYDGKWRFQSGTGFSPQGHLTQQVKSNGETLTYYYKSAGIFPRIQSVVSNFGYMFKYEYYTTDATHPAAYAASTLKKITAINLSVEYCDPNADSCNLTRSWPAWSYNSSYTGFNHNVPEGVKQTANEIATNPLGGSYTLNFNRFQFPSGRAIVRNQPASGLYSETIGGGQLIYDVECYTQYDSQVDTSGHEVCHVVEVYAIPPESDNVCTKYDVKLCVNGNFSVTNGGSTWQYNFNSVSGTTPGYNDQAIMTVTDPTGHTKIITTDNIVVDSVQSTSDVKIRRILSIVDENNKTTSYEYETTFGKVKKITYPEGNKVQLTYDGRGNLTERRDIAKLGSGLADSIWTAYFTPTCANSKICNQPVWTRDAKANLPANINNVAYRTDYTYDATHGGLLTETGPPDDPGVRPQTRYTYSALYPKALNAGGSLVPAATPVYRLTKTSSCRTATAANPASCVGTDQEAVTEYEYANNNLLLTKTTVRAGNANVLAAYSATNLWQSTSQAYDDIGNVVSVDGPLPGTVDQSFTTYDVLRRPVLEIGADPDDTGALKRKIIRHKYDVDGREYETDNGTCETVGFSNGIPQTCSNFVIASYVLRTYDPTTGLEVKSAVMQP